ncbi:ketosteroid isomerase [Favolaschia claudopus]|uniref:Ketosteroid isomerase n=1 Tax=Favolaschia claudopus TaxID=2862362 RepID=A0AAW0DWH1_9AGAR
MTAFTLTKAYTEKLFEILFSDPLTGMTTYFDPSIKTIIAQEEKDPIRHTGVYTLDEWKQVGGSITSRLKDRKLVMVPTAIDVAGNKAFVELAGTATQLNGRPYNNRYMWIMIFNDTGKVVEVREYFDTALVQELMQTNP